MDRQAHWQNVYTTKAEQEVSWFQDTPATSIELITAVAAGPETAIIDVGGGASRLADVLLRAGYCNLTVLDVSDAALAASRKRIASHAEEIAWIALDVTRWQPARQYDLWHDRAALHFLTEAEDREAYIATLKSALRVGGHAIISTFALNGPERCSGLPVVRYDAASLAATLGPSFRLVASRVEEHRTPWGASQMFQFCTFVLA